MKISGFTFLRNASKLYYPFKESILSVIDLVDEWIIMLGPSDKDDFTEEILLGIHPGKIKIYRSAWDLVKYPRGSEYAHQTDLAKEKCTGDWLIYLQGDEVIHEQDQAAILEACKKYAPHKSVEGFVFDFLHFYGDYGHYFRDHTWYKKEIRVIRNLPEIHSWRDAQSFRWIPDFKENDYFRNEYTRPLNCIILSARIFHYGWVRPPYLMASKSSIASNNYGHRPLPSFVNQFDYGRIDHSKIFKDTHPAVMKDIIRKMDWGELLRHSGPRAINRPLLKHEKWKYRVLSFIEENLLGGHVIGGFKNFKAIET